MAFLLMAHSQAQLGTLHIQSGGAFILKGLDSDNWGDAPQEIHGKYYHEMESALMSCDTVTITGKPTWSQPRYTLSGITHLTRSTIML